jgi:hypothetical protein
VNKRSFVSVLVVVVMLLGFSLASAEEAVAPAVPPETKAKLVVATIYVNNAKSTYDNEIAKRLSDRFNAKLVMYDVRPGDKYVEKLKKMGVTDITTAERSDILQAFAGEGIDYLVYVEVQPPNIKRWMSMFNKGYDVTVTIPLKLVDINNDKYLYNGKFTEQADNSAVFGDVGTKAGVFKAMDQIFVKTDEILTSRLPAK